MDSLKDKILKVFKQNLALSSGDVFEVLKYEGISQVTIKRHLSDLVAQGFLEKQGKGRSVKYKLSSLGFFLRSFDVDTYLNVDETERQGMQAFNFDLFNYSSENIFTPEEEIKLRDATEKFQQNKKSGGDTIHKKELERFIIELSWKSSAIEGNTYSLLDTELLLREGLKSNKNTESEAQMILNHKKAFDFIYSHQNYFKELSVKKIEEVHYLLTENLGIGRNLRKHPVGVTGTSYRPLDNEYQIKEAMSELVNFVNKIDNGFVKAIFLIMGISYIQPFEDGNKRTSRLLGNAILLANGFAPLSYRNVDIAKYKTATLIFYEQNSIAAFKKIFIEQYIFACENYNLG